jgi:UDP-N-acetylmuramoylalanine--D-glutamate ligase
MISRRASDDNILARLDRFPTTGKMGGAIGTMRNLNNKRVTVAGLGRFGGGIAVSRWLVEQGARVLVTDLAAPEALADSLKQLDGLPIEYHLGGHHTGDFTSADLVVASPAIPRSDTHLQAAKAAGVPVTTEICLLVDRLPTRTVIGVTGTKGKSTTTAMLGRMLKQANTTWVGGNIGGSLLFDLPHMKANDWVVLELSSYMLDYLGDKHWSPHVALLTLLSQDHLAWHGSPQAYTQAKSNLLRYQSPDDYAVINARCPAAMELAALTRAAVVPFNLTARPFDLLVPGEHNQLNAQGAFAAASLLGVDWSAAQDALREFPGLPHRLQLVHETNGVRYFNDSIATIPEAAIAALQSFPAKTVIQIVGGYDKHLPMEGMCGLLADRAKAILCIGATGPMIADKIGQSQRTGTPPVYQCGDLPTAMTLARKLAHDGDVILLSPGCASYDQFVNFEKRGEEFARLARA